MQPAQTFLNTENDLLCTPILPGIAEQAAQADRTRSVDPGVITAIKNTDLIRASATRNIGGVEAGIGAIARELEAVAGACASTAWCLWNHLCVFHFICGQTRPRTAAASCGRWSPSANGSVFPREPVPAFTAKLKGKT